MLWRLLPFSALLATLAFAAPTTPTLPHTSLQDKPKKADEITPFRIKADDKELKDLTERLARTRFPDQIEDAGWDYGVELGYLKEVVAYWKDKYDWRAWEKKLNAMPQFVTEIDELKIHFVHVRSKEKAAKPLLLVHGWPGSFVEFYKVVGPLTDPVAHGGKAEDAFHVVVPSLPGFGFSGKPTKKGWSMSRMSVVMAKLMSRLGYERYGVQGGDWGAGVARWLGTYDSEHVIGIHVNFPSGGPADKDDPYKGVPDEEKKRYEKRREELKNHYGYSAIQGTRPQTIGYALNDSPSGLAAWIIDKFWAWSDHKGKLENSFTKDELLTNVMIYWLTQTPASSARIYFERQQYTGGRKAGPVPVGVALFPKEINVLPRKWIEAQYRPVHYTEMPRGGHFAALETPDLLVKDVRKFFGALKPKK
jgi:epoxide hydrolase